MNLLLMDPVEINERGYAILAGRRARHIQEVLKSRKDEQLRAGVLGGKLGFARVVKGDSETVTVQFSPQEEPPPALPMTLVLALPRPKVLRRVLAEVTSLGIKEVYLINAYRVEKPYWSSEQVKLEFIRQSCLLGLEQARDTILPKVHIEKLFKPFVEDRLPSIISGTRAYVAHPGSAHGAPRNFSEPVTLVIGPEGGFIPYEIDLLVKVGFQAIDLGPRILKFETAIAVLAGRM